MKTVTLKFGGSSLSDCAQFEKVRSIILNNHGRVFVVASAPGKRFKEDIKVTDLLYSCYNAALAGSDFSSVLSEIEKRFEDIASGIGVSFDIRGELAAIEKHLLENPQRDYMASRGEYLNSKLLASYLGFAFVDPADCIFFNKDGVLDSEKTDQCLSQALGNLDRAVVPGFYGRACDGVTIRTFSRGGSDVTGSLVARAVKADVYENWTDVSGMLSADPRIVENPVPVEKISYRELRELAYMGASVMHEDAVFPVRSAGIPINIRNTNRPEDAGTWIVNGYSRDEGRIITGIAGKKGFSSIVVEKAMMNNEVGFAARFLNAIASEGVSSEHIPSGIDTMSAVVLTEQLMPVKSDVIEKIKETLQPDTIIVENSLALIAVVGHGMVMNKGVAAKVFTALADSNINIRMIDQGSSEMNIIIGVEECDYENAIRSIYKAFFG